MWCPFVKDQSCDPSKCALGIDGSCALARIVQELRFLSEDLEAIKTAISTVKIRSDELKSYFDNARRFESIKNDVKTWIKESSLTVDYYLNTPIKTIFYSFKEWSQKRDPDYSPNAPTFYLVLREHFNFDRGFRRGLNGSKYFTKGGNFDD